MRFPELPSHKGGMEPFLAFPSGILESSEWSGSRRRADEIKELIGFVLQNQYLYEFIP
jgi:hypothetical protein